MPTTETLPDGSVKTTYEGGESTETSDVDPKEALRIRVVGKGMEGWAYRIEDAVTRRYLPCTKFTLTIDPRGDAIVEASILVSEVDIDSLEVWRSRDGNQSPVEGQER